MIDEIRLNVDHRKFGYDDWLAHSAQTYLYAQDKGVSVYIDCAIESEYDLMENPPAELPITKKGQSGLFFTLMHDMTVKMLNTSADGIFFYEHCKNDKRTWEALRSAREEYQKQAKP